MVQIDTRRVLAAIVLLSGSVIVIVRLLFCDNIRSCQGSAAPGRSSQVSILRAGVASCVAADAAAREPTIPEPTWFTGWDNELGFSSGAASRKLMQVCMCTGPCSSNNPSHPFAFVVI